MKHQIVLDGKIAVSLHVKNPSKWTNNPFFNRNIFADGKLSVRELPY